jgi:hypothetical protein
VTDTPEALTVTDEESALIDEMLRAAQLETAVPGARNLQYPVTYSREIELIPPDSVVIGPRQRGDRTEGKGEDDTIDSLKSSIDTINFFGSILCWRRPDDGILLVCGRRRLEALKRKGEIDIPVQFVIPHPDDPDPELTLASIEFLEDVKRLQRDPLNVMESRAKIAKGYLAQRKLDGTKRTQREVAPLLGINEKTLSDTIYNAEFYRFYPEKNRECRTEDDVRKARRLHNITVEQEELARKSGNKQKQHEILCKDFHIWAPAYDGPPFDVVHIDFPYGIGQGDSNQKSRTTEVYEDTPEVRDRLLDTLEEHFNKLVAKDAAVLFWSAAQFPLCSYIFERLSGLRRLRPDWWINQHAFAWVKPSAGIDPIPGRTLRQCYEIVFIGLTGDFRLKKIGIPNWRPGNPPKGEERLHQSQKNEAILYHLLSGFVDHHTRVLDPTCGSGVAIRVAKRLRAAYALGLEISNDNVMLARSGLDKVKEGEEPPEGPKGKISLEDLGL